MYRDIIKLENTLNQLLPLRRYHEAPSKQLIGAAKNWSEAVWNEAQQLGPLSLSPQQMIQGRHLAQNPVFICGVHRSGTTLVRDMLDGHPSLSVLPSEGTFFTNLAPALKPMPNADYPQFLATEWLRRLSNPINQPPYWLLGRSTAKKSPYVDFARAFNAWYAIAKTEFTDKPIWPHLAIILAYATCTNGLNAKYWVDKTPTNEKHLDEIWQQLPAAKVIHLVRHPRAVLLSRKHSEPGLNYKQCLQEMELSFEVAIKHHEKHSDKFLVLHYEDLCNDPGTATTQLSRFLNIENSPCLLTPTVAGQTAIPNSSFAENAEQQGIIKNVASANKKRLEGAEEKLLSAWLHKPAASLGYPLKKLAFPVVWLIRFKANIVRLKNKIRQN